MGADSPTVRRWELAGRLRRLREATGLSLEDVATELLCSPSKISRIETAARSASLRDVRDLCRLYGVDEREREQLMQLVREAKQPGWWQHFDEVASRSATYIGLEDAATSIQNYETILVPGLLQTPDYARAVIRRLNPDLSDEAVEQFAEARQQRQRVLTRPSPPRYWAILDEAVLHRQVGGRKIMGDQIARLIEVASARLVVLQIVPFSVGAHAGMHGPFTILSFDTGELPDVVHVDGHAGQLFLNRDADLRAYRLVLDHLKATAGNPDESIDRLRDLASTHISE
jgi:transcriptional regulator with XRE-family HTH domain